ncbi:MAG TPA: serine hydrolase [Thermoanaerobaculia bacterium]|jgi:CubicO group peptidase (beta-lactamase class C family)|nr:serine hydrolase [Thermoanaerobaculia bacterium]
MRTATAVLLLLLLSACAAAPRAVTDAELRDIDRFVTRTLQTLPEVPSVGLAIVRDGKTYARGYGLADRERNVAATADTGYYNGSNTKAYTAVVCTMLAQEGKIDLDVPVTTYLPEVQFAPPIDASKLTLRRFLSHTSGIENFPVVFRTAFSGEHTPKELVRILSLSKAGPEGFHYDNLGYVIASLIVERVTGRKWQDVLDQRLFEPLGMHRTTAYMSEARRQPVAVPYDMNAQGTMSRIEFGWKDDSMMHAAGGIVTTPNDLAKWLQANLTQQPAYAETQRKQVEAKRDSFIFDGTGYGFGWYQSDLHGEQLLYHGGGYEGWRSVYSLLPEKKMAVGALTNAGFSHSPLELISAYVYDRLLGTANVDATYDEKLTQLRARFDTVKKNHIDDAAKRASRTWTLTHPRDAYAGRYESPTYGTLTIEQRGEKLVATIGRLSAELEPFTNPDSARVELIPGTGEVLQFRFAPGANTPEALKWQGEVLLRK